MRELLDRLEGAAEREAQAEAGPRPVTVMIIAVPDPEEIGRALYDRIVENAMRHAPPNTKTYVGTSYFAI